MAEAGVRGREEAYRKVEEGEERERVRGRIEKHEGRRTEEGERFGREQRLRRNLEKLKRKRDGNRGNGKRGKGREENTSVQ